MRKVKKKKKNLLPRFQLFRTMRNRWNRAKLPACSTKKRGRVMCLDLWRTNTRGASQDTCHTSLVNFYTYITFALHLCLPFLPLKHKHPSKHPRHNQSLLITLRMTTIPTLLIVLVKKKKKSIFTEQTKCSPSLQQNGTRQHLECSKRKQKLDLKTRQR